MSDEQLTLDLSLGPPPGFEQFVPGANVECVAALRALATGSREPNQIYLWGPAGVGKTHLLRASVALATSGGAMGARYLDAGSAPPAFEEGGAGELVAVDDCDQFDEARQQALFDLINRQRAGAGALVLAGGAAPLGLTLREDLRTRLGWGLVFEVHPLSDEHKAWALAAFAGERGLVVAADVIPWLLSHYARDIRELIDLLDRLDRYALRRRRALTLPLLREWLRESPRS